MDIVGALNLEGNGGRAIGEVEKFKVAQINDNSTRLMHLGRPSNLIKLGRTLRDSNQLKMTSNLIK